MIEHILERIREADPLEAHVVTNAKFAEAFREWAPADVTVHDDGTTSEDDRLGAIGDLQFVVERAGIDDDLLVVAGDNLFDYSLADYARWWRSKGVASAVALYEHPDCELVKQYGIVEVDADERIVSFVEKPSEPRSNLAATACYLFHREHVKLVATYLDEGNVPDQPGRFVEWLYRRAPVYGYRFGGDWLDIGDRDQLLEADNRARERAGLPVRDQYVV
jgi:glucose-1-phosphate thymidylyltransferase